MLRLDVLVAKHTASYVSGTVELEDGRDRISARELFVDKLYWWMSDGLYAVQPTDHVTVYHADTKSTLRTTVRACFDKFDAVEYRRVYEWFQQVDQYTTRMLAAEER